MTRFLLILLFFLISLLSVFKAPAYYFWLLAILVTEYPLIFAGITTILVLSGIWVKKYQLSGTIIGIVTIIVFLSPIIKAYFIGYDLKNELNTAFNISNHIPDTNNNQAPFSFTRLFAGKKVVAHKTLSYVSYIDTALTLDFFPAQIAGKKPCVIVIHGGSWSSGDSKQLPELNSYLARAGYNVAAINYRMAPKYRNPAPREDVQNALKYLAAHSEELQIDTNDFVLLGRSAGAQIALLSAYTLCDKNIKGVIDFYGPADMVWGYSVPSNPLVMNSRGVMDAYLGGAYNKVPQNYEQSSPIRFVDQFSIPTLIIHGENDVLVAYEHSNKLNNKLNDAGVAHYWLKLPWATHGFDYNLNGPGGQLSTYAVEHFLKAITTP
ncbi:MAG: lip2 [Mucilaginibacter sp.]|nr:lip2 [Mucilaginibacter sp.]